MGTFCQLSGQDWSYQTYVIITKIQGHWNSCLYSGLDSGLDSCLLYLKSDGGEEMLLILSDTLISKHYYLGLNPCFHIPPHSKFYVKNLVSKHNKDHSSKSLLYRKIGPGGGHHWWDKSQIISMQLFGSKIFIQMSVFNPIQSFCQLLSNVHAYDTVYSK